MASLVCCRSLKEKWQEKSSSIASIEDQVRRMNEGWASKEKKLTEERDKAVKAAECVLISSVTHSSYHGLKFPLLHRYTAYICHLLILLCS